METHKEMAPTAIVDKAISEAEEEYSEGGALLDAGDVLATLRKKHFG